VTQLISALFGQVREVDNGPTFCNAVVMKISVKLNIHVCARVRESVLS
jgi:hypothetical protein